MFDVPYPPGLFASILSLAAGPLIAACWPRFAGVLGFLAGALLLVLVEVGRANVLLLPLQLVLLRSWEDGTLVGQACLCAVVALVCRGFFSGRVRRWWRLL